MKAKEQEREKILRALHASRSEFVQNASDLQGSFQIPYRIRRSLVAYSLWILGGAGVIGFLLASRKRKVVYVPSPESSHASQSPTDSGAIGKKISFLAGAIAMIKWILPVVRPLLVSYASRKASDYVRKN